MLWPFFRQAVRRRPPLYKSTFSTLSAIRTSNSNVDAIDSSDSLVGSILTNGDLHYLEDGRERQSESGDDRSIRSSTLRKKSARRWFDAEPQEGSQATANDKSPASASLSSSFRAEDNFFNADSKLSRLRSDNFLISPWLNGEDLKPSPSVRTLEEAQERIVALLEVEENDGLLENLWDIMRDERVVISLKSTTFVEILRRIDPKDEFLPFRQGYATRIPKHYSKLKGYITAHLDVIYRRRSMYMGICYNRVKSGRQLHVREYAELLKCARATYDGRTAHMIMRAMLLKNLRPDLTCYKHCFEAICWADAWHPMERHLLRVIPYTQSKRLHVEEINVDGERVIHPHKVGRQGLKKDVTDLVTHMIENGILADSEVFGHLITALAREGDMDGVKAVLKSTWDVDVDAVDSAENIGNKLQVDSPLHPDQNTLFIIAHAFGCNSDVPNALRTVDIFAQKYSLVVSAAVWTEILNWSYVLSKTRSKKEKFDGTARGQLSKRTPIELWNLLVGAPYYCQPTLPMYDILIRSERRRDVYQTMLEYIAEVLELLYSQQQAKPGCDAENRPNILATHSKMSVSSQQFIGFVYIQQWFSKLLTGQRFMGSSNYRERRWWERQILPDIVDVFWRYRDSKGVKYNIGTGRVLLQEQGSDHGNSYNIPFQHMG